VNIADIFASVRLNLETGKFEADALKSADVVAKGFGSKLKKAAGGALGAGIGAAFAMASRGVMELNSAMATLQAETGMTAEEAKEASKAMTDLYKSNLQGFDEIGAAMARVHNDLGLAGDAAKDATKQFLKFATATGQDAASAVEAFDDILDNWGLTAADAVSVMDKLIVSHQRYGGSIEDNQRTLAAMAPALRAANFEIDDGIALLGLFGAKGLDANAAAAAFAKALTKVKSPEELQALIADISATKDPFERASKAADLFGARAGAKLANALGGANLDEYKVSITDAAGATEEAAGVIENSMGNRVKILMKQVQGTLTEIGTSVGDLAIVFAMLGPKVMASLGGVVGLLATSLGPKLAAVILGTTAATVPAATAAGEATGAAMSGGIIAGMKTGLLRLAAGLGAVTIPVTVLFVAHDPIADFLGLGAKPGELGYLPDNTKIISVPTVLTPDEEASGEAFREYLRNLPEGVEGMDWSEWQKVGEKGGAEIAGGVEAGMEEEINPIAASLAEKFRTGMGRIAELMRDGGALLMSEIAAGITAARDEPLDAFNTLKDMLKNAMTPTAEFARLTGELTSKALARGLKSNDPAVRAQAEATKGLIIARLEELAASGQVKGEKAARLLKAGLRSKDPEIRAAAQGVKNIVTTQLDKTAPAAGDAGANAAKAFIDRMLARFPKFVREWVAKQLHASGFPGYAAGSWSVPATQLAVVHRGEMIIPAAAAQVIRGEAPAAAAVTAGAASVVVNVPIQSFYGTAQNITELSRAIGQQVRLATVKGMA